MSGRCFDSNTRWNIQKDEIVSWFFIHLVFWPLIRLFIKRSIGSFDGTVWNCFYFYFYQVCASVSFWNRIWWSYDWFSRNIIFCTFISRVQINGKCFNRFLIYLRRINEAFDNTFSCILFQSKFWMGGERVESCVY